MDSNTQKGNNLETEKLLAEMLWQNEAKVILKKTAQESVQPEEAPLKEIFWGKWGGDFRIITRHGKGRNLKTKLHSEKYEDEAKASQEALKLVRLNPKTRIRYLTGRELAHYLL